MIKKIVVALLASFLISAASAQTAPARQAPPPTSVPQAGKEAPKQQAEQNAALSQIKIPVLPPFKPQQPERIQLPNGMVIFLQVDHELPTDRRNHSRPRRIARRTCRQDRHDLDVWRRLAHRRNQEQDWRSTG